VGARRPDGRRQARSGLNGQGRPARTRTEQLTTAIIELARRYGRYGYRKVAELPRSIAGWVVDDKRAERIWRREGLEVPERFCQRSCQQVSPC
jgi:hypothetical protein